MLDAIKKIIKKTKGVLILVEDNEPAYVVLPFAEYEKLLEEQTIGVVPETSRERTQSEAVQKDTSEYELLKKINRDIEIWKTAQRERETDLEIFPDSNDGEEEIKIEKIPYG